MSPQRIGRGAIGVGADVTVKAQVDGAAAAILAAFGRVDILVNNAGITHRNRPMLEVGEEEFDRVMSVNVKSIYLTAHAFVPAMRKSGGGVILNIGSTAGIRPRPGLAWYNASKGAVHILTKSMATELAADKIRVCALAPAAGETPLLPMFLGEDTPERRAAFHASHPDGPAVDADRRRQRGAVSGERRSGVFDGGGVGGGWRAVHLGGADRHDEYGSFGSNNRRDATRLARCFESLNDAGHELSGHDAVVVASRRVRRGAAANRRPARRSG